MLFLEQELRGLGHLFEVLAQLGALTRIGSGRLDLRLERFDRTVLLHDRYRDRREDQHREHCSQCEVQVLDVEAFRTALLLRQQVDRLQVRVVAPAAGDDVGLHAEV
jgi:hypothetical protein